jgi:hypothetical protein
LNCHVSSFSFIEILVKYSLLSIAMPDTDLEMSQLLIVLKLIYHKDKLLKTNLERVRWIIERAKLENP